MILDGVRPAKASAPRPPRPREHPAWHLPPGARAVADAAAGTCRWPFDWPEDESFRFCGAPALPASSYCVQHRRLSLRTEAAR